MKQSTDRPLKSTLLKSITLSQACQWPWGRTTERVILAITSKFIKKKRMWSVVEMSYWDTWHSSKESGHCTCCKQGMLGATGRWRSGAYQGPNKKKIILYGNYSSAHWSVSSSQNTREKKKSSGSGWKRKDRAFKPGWFHRIFGDL